MCSLWLPGEVWTLVFGHLPMLDRLRVRTTCKYFRDLVDNGDLWRDRTVELRRSSEEYEEHFWHMLRRWRVTSVWLWHAHNWTHIAKELPALSTLIINYRYFTGIQDLRSLTNLERLYLAHLPSPVHFEKLSAVLPQQLMHLVVCQQMFDTNSLLTEIPLDSPLKKLKSLSFHCEFDSHPMNALHFFLSSLPQLQHLSLSVHTDTSFEGLILDLPPLHNCSLASLELLGCDTTKLPMDFMKILSPLPFLRSLAIFCLHDSEEESLKLSSWLKDLPPLTSLLVQCAPMAGFVRSIPSSVTRLSLNPPFINPEDLIVLSAQLPNLRHLHLQPFRAPLCSNTALIPQLFPGLRTLCLSHEKVPENLFLSLASLKELKELEVLETLMEELSPDALISKFQALTNSKVWIYKSPKKPWMLYCICATNTCFKRGLFYPNHLNQLF